MFHLRFNHIKSLLLSLSIFITKCLFLSSLLYNLPFSHLLRSCPSCRTISRQTFMYLFTCVLSACDLYQTLYVYMPIAVAVANVATTIYRSFVCAYIYICVYIISYLLSMSLMFLSMSFVFLRWIESKFTDFIRHTTVNREYHWVEHVHTASSTLIFYMSNNNQIANKGEMSMKWENAFRQKLEQTKWSVPSHHLNELCCCHWVVCWRRKIMWFHFRFDSLSWPIGNVIISKGQEHGGSNLI